MAERTPPAPRAKLSKRQIKELAHAIVDAMVPKTTVTKRGGLVFEMKLPKLGKAKRKSKHG